VNAKFAGVCVQQSELAAYKSDGTSAFAHTFADMELIVGQSADLGSEPLTSDQSAEFFRCTKVTTS